MVLTTLIMFFCTGPPRWISVVLIMAWFIHWLLRVKGSKPWMQRKHSAIRRWWFVRDSFYVLLMQIWELVSVYMLLIGQVLFLIILLVYLAIRLHGITPRSVIIEREIEQLEKPYNKPTK